VPSKEQITILSRQDREKQILLEQLKRTPIVEFACQKVGIARATYYRWRQDDERFRKDADTALQEGVLLVNDMAESIAFYTEKLGLKLLRGPLPYPGNADMAFVGHDWDAYIELVYDLEVHPPYELGNRYEHLALEVGGDLAQVCDRLRAQGVKVIKGPKKSPGGTRSIAFVEDPNGLPIALLEPKRPAAGA